MATKSPLKFYDTVMKQKVNEHKVSRARTFEGQADGEHELPKKKVLKKGKTLELRSRVTIRAIARILLAVQRKLEDMLVDHTAEDVSPDEIQRAMSHPATQEVVQKHVARENIKLVKKGSQEPVFQRQMSEIGEKGVGAADGPPNLDESLLECDPEEA